MRHPGRTINFALALVIALVGGPILYAHTYVGLLDPVNARARVQSPNANVADYPVPIPGTDLSVVCFKVRNASPQPNDSRITAIGFDVPGEATGYALISPLDSAFHLIEQVSLGTGVRSFSLLEVAAGTGYVAGRTRSRLRRHG